MSLRATSQNTVREGNDSLQQGQSKTNAAGSLEGQAGAATKLDPGDNDTTQQETETPELNLPFFKQDPFTDVVLQVGGKKLYTCRALLAYNSPVLAKVFSSGSSRNKDLDLPEKEYEDIVELLAYIDPRVDYIITEQSALALLPLAEEYKIDSLKSLCEETTIKSFRGLKKHRKFRIPVDVTLAYLQMADKYKFTKLRDAVTEEFVKNDDHMGIKSLLRSTLISEHSKLTILDKKVEKAHVDLENERRERTSIETKLGHYGNRRSARSLQD